MRRVDHLEKDAQKMENREEEIRWLWKMHDLLTCVPAHGMKESDI